MALSCRESSFVFCDYLCPLDSASYFLQTAPPSRIVIPCGILNVEVFLLRDIRYVSFAVFPYSTIRLTATPRDFFISERLPHFFYLHGPLLSIDRKA